jgi:hypothetical protein
MITTPEQDLFAIFEQSLMKDININKGLTFFHYGPVDCHVFKFCFKKAKEHFKEHKLSKMRSSGGVRRGSYFVVISHNRSAALTKTKNTLEQLGSDLLKSGYLKHSDVYQEFLNIAHRVTLDHQSLK